MASSGSVDFSRTRDEIITHALQVCKMLAEGGTATAQQITDGSAYLNLAVKWLQSKEMPLWALKTGYILPISDVNELAVTSHVVHSYTQTQLAADAASSASTISVDSATGFTNGNPIGVELEDGTMHWTTINGAPSGTTITLTTALTAAADTDGVVYTYATTARVYRPLRVVHATTYDVLNETSSSVEIISNQEYEDLNDKTGEGIPTQLYYDPQLAGVMYWYPRFQNGDRVIKFRYHRPFEDFDATGDTPDFPQEWYLPLVWVLAWCMSPITGMPLEERSLLLKEAGLLIDAASAGTSQEEDSVQFTPAWPEHR